MGLEQIQETVKWLEYQIAYLESSIDEANQANNYGRKIQHQGMKEAYEKCLGQLNKLLTKKKTGKQIQDTNI